MGSPGSPSGIFMGSWDASQGIWSTLCMGFMGWGTHLGLGREFLRCFWQSLLVLGPSDSFSEGTQAEGPP